jgi:SAM-dependent methyltransferase
MSLIGPLKKKLFPRLAGLEHEVGFWEVWFGRRGWKRPDIFQRMMDPEAPLGEALVPLVDRIDADPVMILDVGAGPITGIGWRHPRKAIKIKAVDPLAEQYDRILYVNGIKPLVRTIYAEGESLTQQVKRHGYHLVTCINALDHMCNPSKAIREMVAACKPGGCVYLAHNVDEAETQGAVGLHQWNLRCDNGHLTLRAAGTHRVTDLEKQLAGLGEWKTSQTEMLVECEIWKSRGS